MLYLGPNGVTLHKKIKTVFSYGQVIVRMDDSPHAFKKLQMVFLSLHAFEVVSNILEKVCSKALKHSLQFSVVVKLNFSQPRDVVLIKSTNLES